MLIEGRPAGRPFSSRPQQESGAASGRRACRPSISCGGGPGGVDVPRPATIVLDRDGVIRWLSLSDNYQVRPDPAEVMRAVRAL